MLTEYNRVLIKVSGEWLLDESGAVIDINKIKSLCDQVKYLVKVRNIQVALVIGGGNISRGANLKNIGISPHVSDDIGMISTIINGIAISDVFNQLNLPTSAFSAIEFNKIINFYNVQKVLKKLNNNSVVILSGGIATPFFSTDTTAIVRAIELNCNAVFKGTLVDGIYNKDPKKDSSATMFKQINYNDVITKDLQVLDLQSVIIAKKAKMPIYIFNICNQDGIINIIDSKGSYSEIS